MNVRPNRRSLLIAGGECLAGITLGRLGRATGDTGVVDILMRGTPDGSRLVPSRRGPGAARPDDPLDLRRPHQRAHRLPSGLYGHMLRIPAGAAPWPSDYLLEGESFGVTLTAEGVYDYCCVYCCVPHEHGGMVGRIVVGRPDAGAVGPVAANGAEPIPDAARAAFPTIEEIMADGIVRPRP